MILHKCSTCKIEKPLNQDHFYFSGGYARICKQCSNSPAKRAYQKIYGAKLRLIALQKYSGSKPSCKCCGENTLEFLGIDHIKGRGNIHRKQLAKEGTTMYLWLRKNNYPFGFRVLCHNCNLALGYYHYCPHKNLIKT
jgi:hypothetical protein